ncbi:MAG: histidinol dehydrogenase, partial [Elusimicrobia bacterium]|nr:histidinol dehydrogenase [Elusimicrobiota bacterium]
MRTMKQSIEQQVSSIIRTVRREGDRALCMYLKEFDGITIKPSSFRVKSSVLRAAENELEPFLYKALAEAARNITEFYTQEKKQIVRNWQLRNKQKTIVQRWVPLSSVAVYAPGGRFSYPSTVLMAALPARVAGVKRIVLVSPPGKITPSVCAAARMAGITEFYRIGGPAAIAALAYGTRTIPRVDKIVGPGNAFVTEAKKQIFGIAGIDMLAGPS